MAVPSELRVRIRKTVRQYLAETKSNERGIGQTFAEMEDDVCNLADEMAEELLAELLSEQAAQAAGAPPPCCPRCGKEPPQPVEPHPRLLDMRRGEVSWQEPKYYCRSCRQDFFPSVPRAGD